MIRHRGELLAGLAGFLGLLSDADSFDGQEYRDKVRQILEEYRQFLADAELTGGLSVLDTLLTILPIAPDNVIAAQISVLQTTLHRELVETPCYQVTKDRAAFLTSQLFGFEVADRFPSAAYDIEEAGRCLAFNLDTAALFHLMRVIQIGLGVVARSLDVSIETNPSWHSVLDKLTKRLDVKCAESRAWTVENRQFYSAAIVQFSLIKDAWRNPVMHVSRGRSEEDAIAVFHGTMGFMQKLAQRFREDTPDALA